MEPKKVSPGISEKNKKTQTQTIQFLGVSSSRWLFGGVFPGLLLLENNTWPLKGTNCFEVLREALRGGGSWGSDLFSKRYLGNTERKGEAFYTWIIIIPQPNPPKWNCQFFIFLKKKAFHFFGFKHVSFLGACAMFVVHFFRWKFRSSTSEMSKCALGRVGPVKL